MKGLKINTKMIAKIDTKINSEIPNEPMKNHKLECSHIFDSFFISGYNVSLNKEFLLKENFTHIINCAASSQIFKPEIFTEFEYLLLDVKDDPGFDIIYAIYMTIDFLEKAVNSNGKILIHCVEGVSRGPALFVSYIMWKYSLDKFIAIEKVKQKRRCVDINFGFMVQLGKWEEIILLKDKNMKFYNFGVDGNISIIDKGELVNYRECDFNNLKFSIVLFHQNEKYYKIVTNNTLDQNNKITHFIKLLQLYYGFDKNYITLNLDINFLNKNFFEMELEKVLNYSYIK